MNTKNEDAPKVEIPKVDESARMYRTPIIAGLAGFVLSSAMCLGAIALSAKAGAKAGTKEALIEFHNREA